MFIYKNRLIDLSILISPLHLDQGFEATAMDEGSWMLPCKLASKLRWLALQRLSMS